MGFVQKAWDSVRGKDAAREAAATSIAASNVAADAQTQALDYLKQREALPQAIREEALQGLRGFYEVPDAPMSQKALINQAVSSPLYQAILGSRKSGEDAILRNASATGGLRSGNSNAALSDFNMQLENQALLESFNQAQERQDYERALHLQGIAGLAGLESNANSIANLTSGIGMTKAQGMTGAAQAGMVGAQNTTDTILGIGNMVFSDIRLKKNIRFKEIKNGWAIYEWDWIPEAVKLGLKGSQEGVLAHQVYERKPEAVGAHMGFLTVDYSKLDLEAA